MKQLFFIVSIIIFCSCAKDDANEGMYLKLDNNGETILSGLNVNDTIKFAGTNGTKQEYKIFKIEKTKEVVQDCNWNTGACKVYYFFDMKKCYFIRTDSFSIPPNSPLTYTFGLQMVLPAGIDKKNIPSYVKAKTEIFGNAFIGYNAIPPATPYWSSPYISYPDFYSNLTVTSYTNTVRTYSEIVVIKSGNNSIYTDPLYGTKYTINEVGFDKKYGFIYFKDVFGNVWYRTN